MKNKGISKLVAVAPLVLTPLVFTSCKPATATTIVIKGSSLLNGAPLVAGKVYFEADTDTGDNISNEVDWSLNGDEPE
jgi:hypothetical protein